MTKKEREKTDKFINEKNICLFVKSSEVDAEIVPLNFVYEKNWHNREFFTRQSFTIGLVTEGKGRLKSDYFDEELSEGDLFITYYGREYAIINEDNLKFMFISFIGSRVYPIFERLNVAVENPPLHGFQGLISFWKESIGRTNENNGDIVGQAVLYQSFSYMADKCFEKRENELKADPILEIKRYVDNNFNSKTLNLDEIAKKFGYNKKYISEKFKKTMAVSFVKYVADRRMNYAKTLLGEGNYTVSQICEACGYGNPLYFSKVFKSYFGVSPSEMKNGKQ